MKEKLLRAMLGQCSTAVAYHKVICDMHGTPVDFKFVQVNAAFEGLTGLTTKDIIGRNAAEVLTEAPQLEWIKKYGDIGLKGVSKDFWHYAEPNRWYKVNVFSPQRQHFAVFITDISQELDDTGVSPLAATETEAVRKAKSQFLANMSHELRTPLNSIIGMADLLEETSLSDAQQEYVKIFKTAGETLLSLVDDMLDISRMESGSIELECSPFNLPELVANTAELMSVRAAKKHLGLSCLLDPVLPDWVSGDQGRLKQILLNLLGNAVKFTVQGRVDIKVTLIEPEQEIKNDPEDIGLLFAVSDTGPGIPKEAMSQLFEAFFQVDSSSTRQYGGSGLGLAISKKLINLMDGDIWIESTIGQGSTIYFTVWVKTPAEAKKPGKNQVEEMPTVDPLNILLVEDSQDNRFLIQHYMKTTPHHLDIAVNGQAATAKAKDSEYDLILMDIQMPVMDGYEATRAIRTWEAENARRPVPIVALTAYAQDEDVQKMLANGFDLHLSKPIKKATLLDLISRIPEICRSPGAPLFMGMV